MYLQVPNSCSGTSAPPHPLGNEFTIPPSCPGPPLRCKKERNNKNPGLKQASVTWPGEIMQELEEKGIFLRRGRFL